MSNRRRVAFAASDSDSDTGSPSQGSITEADAFGASVTSEYDDGERDASYASASTSSYSQGQGSPVPGLDFSRLSPAAEAPSRSEHKGGGSSTLTHPSDFKDAGSEGGGDSPKGARMPASVPGSSPQPKTNVDKKSAAAAKARLANALKDPQPAGGSSMQHSASAHTLPVSTPEQQNNSNSSILDHSHSMLNLTQQTSSPYNISSSPYEARGLLSTSFADTVGAHSAGSSPAPAPTLAPAAAAGAGGLARNQLLAPLPLPGGGGAALRGLSKKADTKKKPVKIKASAASRMDDSTRGDSSSGAYSEMDDSAHYGPDTDGKHSYGNDDKYSAEDQHSYGNDDKYSADDLRGMDDSSHHHDARITVKNRKGKGNTHTDLRTVGGGGSAAAGAGGNLYSQQEFRQSNLGGGDVPSPVGILQHLNSFGSPIALQEQQRQEQQGSGVHEITGLLSASGKHFAVEHGVGPSPRSHRHLDQQQQAQEQAYTSPVRYLAEAPAHPDLSPIVVASPDRLGDRGDRGLQDLAFADDDSDGEGKGEGEGEGGGGGGQGYGGGGMDRSWRGERDEEDEEGEESDGSDAPAFGDKRDKRRNHRRHKAKNGCFAICSDILQDVRSYLRDIECEELLPDCSPASWRRLCCTPRGRASMAKPVLLYITALANMLCKMNVTGNREKDIPTLAVIGLGISFFIETYASKFDAGPRYNVIIFLALIIAGTYPHFPTKKMSPQIVFTVLVAVTLGLDCVTIFLAPLPPPALIRTLTAIQCICKVYTLQTHFLQHARGTMKARKYLWRRLRLFLVPFNEPRRLMKDIRGRIMAVGWVQLIAACVYAACFAASITTYGYQIMAGAGRAGVSLPLFLLLKGISSAALFVGILLDTDVTLSLAYFGCLGWNMAYVKKYTRQKKEELGGWPYAYFYNSTRYTFLTMGKCVDFAWGVVGWITLSSHFGKSFSTLDSSLKFFLSLVLLTLACTDIWVPILMYCINWLIRRHTFMLETETLSDSDDSELDELGIRTVHSPLKGHDEQRGMLSRRRRQREENLLLWGDEDSPPDDQYDLGNSDSDTESSDSDLSASEVQRRRRKRKERQKMRIKSRRLALKAFLHAQEKGVKEKEEVARLPRKWSGKDVRSAAAEEEEEEEEDEDTVEEEGGAGDRTGREGDESDEEEEYDEEAEAYDEEVDWDVPDQDDMAHAPSQFASSRTPRRDGAVGQLAEWELEDTPPRLKKQQEVERRAQAREQERERRELEVHKREKGGSPEALVAKGSFYGQLEDNPENLQMDKQEIEVDYGTYSDPEEEEEKLGDAGTGDIMLDVDLDEEGQRTEAEAWAEEEEEAESPHSQRFVFTWGGGQSDADSSFDRDNATARMDTSFERPGGGMNLLANALGSSRSETDRSESIFDLSAELDPFEVKALAGGFKRDSDDEDEEPGVTEGGSALLSGRNSAVSSVNERILIAQAQAKAGAPPHALHSKGVYEEADKGYGYGGKQAWGGDEQEEEEEEEEEEEGEYGGEERSLLAAEPKVRTIKSNRARPPPPSRSAPLSPLTPSKRREVGDLNVGRLPMAARVPSVGQEGNAYISEPGSIITAPPTEVSPGGGGAEEVVLDLNPFIKPDAFSHLWEVLAVAAEFGCNVTAMHQRVSSGAVVQHLTRLGFCVVATGALTDSSPSKRPRFDSLDGFKVFVFASGYLRGTRDASPKPIFCLMEVVLARSKSQGGSSKAGSRIDHLQRPPTAAVTSVDDQYKLSCSVKCTEKKRAAAFIAELSLGDLFNLLD